jgi:hypothetical protein
MPGRLLIVAAVVAALSVAGTAQAAVTFVSKFGSAGTGNGQFRAPRGLAIDSSGNVYVGDGNNSRVQKFTASGGFLTRWGSLGTGNGQFGQNSTYSIAISPSNSVFVSDRNNHRIQRFTQSGGFVSRFGAFGNDPGELNGPQGVAVDGAGNVYVSEYSSHRVSKFTAAGAFVNSWGSRGSGNGQFVNPADLAADSGGNVYVVDTGNHRIQKFSSTGAFVTKWGAIGSASGQFRSPEGIATDGGSVWVVDTLNYRVQRFDPNGRFLESYGSRGPGNTQFNAAPTKAAVRDGGLYVAETAANRIVRLGVSVPPPVLGRAVNVRVVRGRVSIRLPAGASGATATASQSRGRRFVPLRRARQIPVGSLLDTRRGTVRLTSAVNTAGRTQTSDFGGGIFQVLQSRRRSARGFTELRLGGGSFRGCVLRGASISRAMAHSARRSRRTVRRLRARGRGRFRTRGRYASATVRGTTWTTTDRCDGTLVSVARGRVAVRDFRRRRTINVRAGRRYLARAPG